MGTTKVNNRLWVRTVLEVEDTALKTDKFKEKIILYFGSVGLSLTEHGDFKLHKDEKFGSLSSLHCEFTKRGDMTLGSVLCV